MAFYLKVLLEDRSAWSVETTKLVIYLTRCRYYTIEDVERFLQE